MAKNVKTVSRSKNKKITAPTKKRTAKKTRYVIVGTGGRSWMYTRSIVGTYSDHCELAAFCDVNFARMQYYNDKIKEEYNTTSVPVYAAKDFDRMIKETKADVVIVTTIDRTHDQYIIRAMELGCDVITEKPLTINAPKCRAILRAVKKTGRKLTVTFNYRYAPIRSKAKELIRSGAIGEVKSVHFEWLLDTRHGADYFRRWHRDKANSGGLMVHKATHHFDLVNWWIDSTPETVFAFGNLAFYGKENAKKRGVKKFYARGTGDKNAKGDPFALDLTSSESLRGLYLNAEKEDGYKRDLSVFSEGITIEDTMNVLVRYKNGVQMSYSLYAYAPWEGYRIAFNGTKGRIEIDHQENSYISAETGKLKEGATSSQRLLLMPHFKKPQVIKIEQGVGGHGGGDVRLLDDIFLKRKKADPLKRAANHIDGAKSILTGIAANQSFKTGKPVKVSTILDIEKEA